jgi:hypothetical protein
LIAFVNEFADTRLRVLGDLIGQTPGLGGGDDLTPPTGHRLGPVAQPYVLEQHWLAFATRLGDDTL